MTIARAAALAAVGLCACTAGDGRPPVARIELVPDQLEENDGFQTAVTLDGRASADPVDHPDGADLSFAWQILDDEVRFEPGSHPDRAAPVVRLRGDRPATIVLTVTDDDGLTSTTTAHMRLTASPPE
ncbi:MAG TPA: hypothetical protein VHE35_14615 [Kofleriaceae bacterium]|nr:hypothetical protein [Kofleriaceae bacterium]